MQEKSKFYKDIWFISLANFIWALGFSMYINFFPIHIRQLGGNDFVVSLIISIPLFAGILCIIGGIMADYMDRKKIMVFGWAITIPAPLIWIFADRWEWLLVGTIFYSLTLICVPALTIYIFNHEFPGNKMPAFSIISISGMAASFIGPGIGGFVWDHSGTQTLYLLIFLLYVLSTICMLLISKQHPGNPKPVKQYLKWNNIFGAYAVKKLVIIFLFLSSLAFIDNISSTYLPLFLNDYKKMAIDQIGVAFTALAIGSTLFIWLYGKATGKISIHTAIIAGLMVFLLSVVMVIALDNTYLLFSALLLRGISAAITVYITGIIAIYLTGENKGFILSLYITVRSIFIGFAAFPGAWIYQVQPILLFYAEGILIVVWVLVSFHPYFRKYWHNPDFQQ